MKFRLPPAHPPDPALRQAYILGPDRTPTPSQAEVRQGLLTIRRVQGESGRAAVPWLVPGHGRLVLSTGSLAERFEPYDLAVELARGTLNDVQNQLADWQLLGLHTPAELLSRLRQARQHFARAATSRDQPEAAAQHSALALTASLDAGRDLAAQYTTQVLQRRRELTSGLSTLLRIDLPRALKTPPADPALFTAFDAARLKCEWGTVATDAGHYNWDIPDAQLSWCRKHKLVPQVGPLIDLRPRALPDWLWLWQGDADEITTQALDFVRAAVQRYRGKVAAWHILARPASGDVIGLREEQQVNLAANLIQAARQIDPSAHLVIDLDRPWADWMSSSPFQLGPLHLADSLARADIGLTALGLEVAPGMSPWGSPARALLEFSRLLDLYALISLPLHVSLAAPSTVAPPPDASGLATPQPDAWPTAPDEATQLRWASQWFALAAAKPFVHTVGWLELDDATPDIYSGCGLLRADRKPKPALDWIASFRRDHRTH